MGDRSAFAQIVERYWDRLYRWLYHLAHDAHVAEDLTQETLLKAFAHLNKFRLGTNFRAWLFRIGHNNFINTRRRQKGTKQALPTDLATDQPGPAEVAISQEAVAAVAQAITRLPVDFRSAFLLRVEEGLSFKQIAEVLDLTEQTARWRVFKARQKLLQVLHPDLAELAASPEPDGP
jgi:RNA polymerase sigma-70 factor (ECF subfamily)